MKAVFLDSGGVITRLDVSKPAVFFEACREKELEVSRRSVEKAFNAVESLLEERQDLLLANYPRFRILYMDALRQETGLGRHLEDVFQEYMRLLQSPQFRSLYEDALPAIRAIKNAGLKLAVVSNGSKELIPLLFRLGVAPYFDAITVSDLLGFDKPQEEIFLVALSSLEVDAAETVHVGDSYYIDYLGATNAGLEAFLLDREGTSQREVPRLRSLQELPTALQL